MESNCPDERNGFDSRPNATASARNVPLLLAARRALWLVLAAPPAAQDQPRQRVRPMRCCVSFRPTRPSS